MRSVLYLAARYLASHPVKTGVLVASIALILYLPLGLGVLVRESEREMRARAESTPLIVGVKGSPLELVLGALYFSAETPEPTRYGEVARIDETGLALAIPIHVGYRADDAPIVGTSLDYFDRRGLSLARGGAMTRLGDCVLGARVAERRGLGPEDRIVSSPVSVLNLAGPYPLKMRITGVLAPTGGPDDDAVFVDVRTTWVIQGLAHGHEDLTRPEAEPRLLGKDEGVVTANASVVEYTEITDANVDSFHFHGDPADFPITAVLAFPRDRKSGTLLRGRYLGPDERHQILRPKDVVEELMDTVLTIEGYVVAALAVVGGAALATAALTFWLSVRLRRREIATMVRIGGSRLRIAAILVAEVLVVVLAAGVVAAVLTGLTAWLGADAVRSIVA